MPHIFAIGSLLSATTPQSYVWGTGVMHPDLGIGDTIPSRILALRGKLSHQEFHRAGKNVKDIPLGDPGFLIGYLIPVGRASTSARYVVPHYVDRCHPFIMHCAEEDGVKILDVTAPSHVFFDDMRQCKAIISSSLHGLVFAEALSIPNLWIELSDAIAGQGFKFRDWFLAQNPQADPIHLSPGEPIESLIARCEPRQND